MMFGQSWSVELRRLTCCVHILVAMAASFYTATSEAEEKSNLAANFARQLDMPFLKISPDGSKLVTALSTGYNWKLVILGTAPLAPLDLDATFGEIYDAQWADENNLLVVADDDLDESQVWRVNLEKKSVTQLTLFSDNSEFGYHTLTLFPPYTYEKGVARVILSYRDGSKAFRINLKDDSITRERYFHHPNEQLFPDADTDTRLSEEWEKDKYSITYTPVEGGTAKILYQGSTTDDNQIHPLYKIPHSTQMYVSVLGKDREKVQLYDIETNTLGATVLKDEHYDVSASAVFLPYSGDVIGMQYMRDKMHTEYLDSAIGKFMAGIDKALPGQINSIVSASKDKSQFVILSSGDTDPGAFYLYSASKKQLTKLIDRAEWLDKNMLSRMQAIHFKARDGLEIEAYLTVPARTGENKPLIVLPHGGPQLRDEWGYDPWAQFLAARGYTVIQPNYRGSTGYGAEFFKKGKKQVGYAMEDDIFDAYAWAQQQGYAKNGDACIMGGSFGGYAAMRAATVSPSSFKCVITIAGFYDIEKLLEADRRSDFYFIMTDIYGDPFTDQDRLYQASPIHFISALTAPVLLIHGKLDNRVKYEQAEELLAELSKQHKTVTSLLRPEEGHFFRKESNRRKEYEEIGAFLDKYLPTSLTPNKTVSATQAAR